MREQRTPPPNFYAGPYLEREAELRDDPAWLDAARADPSTLYVVARGTTHLIAGDPAPRIAFLKTGDPLLAGLDSEHAVLLGRFAGARCVLIDLSDLGEPSDVGALGGADELAAGEALRFEELRPLSNMLPERDAALLAYTRGLAVWRARHRYCGTCGSRTMPQRAGHVLVCTSVSCGRQAFPRIDPAIIVLVTDGERALLGRQANWPAGRYSTIAGFVEPGESLEDAVAREVFEETGVRIASAHYHSSQPWPFPSSLMVGFEAQAATLAITRRDAELEDARWFSRADIAAGTPMLPTATSISYRLIETWFDAGAETPLADQPHVARWDVRQERR